MRPAGRKVVVATALLAACEPQAQAPTERFSVALEEGVPVARNLPLDPDLAPPGWSVRELFRLGSAGPEGGPVAFGEIDGVEVDGEGMVYVLDGQASTIRVFSSDGTHVRNIGGPGEGPGELNRPSGMVLSHDGRLLVRERGRYSLFERDGTLVDTYFRTSGGGRDPVLAKDGKIYESAVLNVDFLNRTGDYVYFASEPVEGLMVPLDTIERPVEVVSYWWVDFGGTTGEGGMVRVPFAPRSQDFPDPRGGFWRGVTDRFRFTHHGEDGEVTRVVERTGEGEPLTASDRSREIEELRASFGNRIHIDPGDLPDRKPTWTSFFVDDEGRLWVERYRDEDVDPLTPRPWEVYDPAGRYLGMLPLPMEATPRPRLRGDRMVATVRDALDVPYVVVFEARTGG